MPSPIPDPAPVDQAVARFDAWYDARAAAAAQAITNELLAEGADVEAVATTIRDLRASWAAAKRGWRIGLRRTLTERP